jgi:hypothetical protein
VTAVVVSGIDSGGTALLTADPEETDSGRSEPEDGGEEGEGNDRLELAASITTRLDVGPVPDATTDLASDELC